MNKRASRMCAAAASGLFAIMPLCAPWNIAAAQNDAAAQSGAATQGAPATQGATAAPGDTAAPGTAADDIRDIRGPKPLFPWALVLLLAAGAALMAAGAYMLWRRRQRRPARPLTYFEIALKRLEELRAIMRPASVREFSSDISDTVRRYIEAGFNVTATHQTTEEFLYDILKDEKSPLAQHRALLAEFLRQCDLAKFAGMSLSVANMESLYQSARSFVVGTIPAT
jgi:Domain of unknown function (DUF4381)